MKFAAITAALLCASGLFVQNSYAQNVDIKDAWVRTSVQGQKASGAFMTLTAKQATRLVSITTPVAGVAQVHEMKMDSDVMRMRALPDGLDLPAGKPVALSPGGSHVMLMDLKAVLPKDSTVPMTLVFKDAQGVESKLEVKLTVATTAPGSAAAAHSH
ncbi:MAG: copper chaperone PCu(A)C [Ferruginibacter sp.]|nr:copper chaperone PCu(A)C [Rhodoferax sp.]